MRATFKNRNNLDVVVEIHEPGEDRVVFIMHGLSGSRKQTHILFVKDIFLKHGYTIVTFDATNSFGESEGLHKNTTIGQFNTDLEDVVEWSKKQDWFRTPFSLCGFSTGGHSVIKYAEKYPSNVRCIIPIAPVVSGKEYHAVKKQNEPEIYNSWKEKGVYERMSISRPGLVRRLPWSYMEDILKHDVHRHVGRLQAPVLLIANERDASCPVRTIQLFYQKIPSKIKRLIIIDGAPHDLVKREHLDLLASAISSFIVLLENES